MNDLLIRILYFVLGWLAGIGTIVILSKIIEKKLGKEELKKRIDGK